MSCSNSISVVFNQELGNNFQTISRKEQLSFTHITCSSYWTLSAGQVTKVNSFHVSSNVNLKFWSRSSRCFTGQKKQQQKNAALTNGKAAEMWNESYLRTKLADTNISLFWFYGQSCWSAAGSSYLMKERKSSNKAILRFLSSTETKLTAVRWTRPSS